MLSRSARLALKQRPRLDVDGWKRTCGWEEHERQPALEPAKVLRN